MSSTLVQLRDQIILDADIKGNTQFPTLRLNKIINLAQRYVQAQLNGLGYKKFETSQAITAGLSAAAYSASSNNVKKCAVNATYFAGMLESPKSILCIEVNDGSSYGVAYEIDPIEFQEQLLNTFLAPTVSKPAFMRLSGYVWLAPTTITAATAYYYKNITELSSDSDQTEIPVEFEEYIIKKSVIEIQDNLGKVQDKEGKLQLLNKSISSDYEKFFGKINELNRNKNLDRAKLQ